MQLPYLKNEKPVHTFNWVLNRKNILDPIEKDDIDALPLPTKLNVVSFQDIKDHIQRPMISDKGINEFGMFII